MSKYPYRPLVEWMVENKVPDDWADDALILVDEARQEIQVEMFMRHPDGGFMIHGSAGCFTEMRTFPMLTPPPPGLLQAYERMRASLREERSAVAAIERKTVDKVVGELWDAGHKDAAQWLASRGLANPPPTRELVSFRAEAARLGRVTVDGRMFAPDCKITVRDAAPLYRAGARIVGHLYGHDVDAAGVVHLLGKALPMVARQLESGEAFPAIDGQVDMRKGSAGLIQGLEIVSAMVMDIAEYPWRNDQIGGPDVGA